jgi:hypothetical protein
MKKQERLNNVEVEDIREIGNNYFNPESEDSIYGLIGLLRYKGFISVEKSDMLRKEFKAIEYSLWSKLKEDVKIKLKENFK